MNAAFAPAFYFDETCPYNVPHGGAYGNAVLCKHPVTDQLHVLLPCDPNQDPKGGEVRSACFLKTEVNGFVFWMGGSHLDYREDESSRIWQANILRDYIAKMDGHIFFAGDMNAEPDSKTMATFSEYMQLNYRDMDQKTWPSDFVKDPPHRVLIDYIMYRKPDKHIKCLSYEVINNNASDHCAVVAKFRVK
jgi:endonuclease/exonuclease/phosphatase family metal-dependent hydrolase